MNLAQASSIRQKLRSIVLRSSLVSLLLAGLGLAALDLARHARSMQHDLETMADVLALTSQAALSFSDPQAATEDLSVLRAKPAVVAAALYDAQGGMFASYVGAAQTSELPVREPRRGSHLGWRFVEVVRPIAAGQDALGSIYVRGEHQLLQRLLESLAALAVILAASLGAGIALTNRLQRSITEPVTAISEVARKVLRGEAHEVRAEKKSDDEVGELVEAFNAMLAELRRRAGRLEESNRAKDRFLATLAHELRNPLAPIRTGLEILKKEGGGSAASARARATMERQLVHMVHLIDDLLDIARVNTGKFKLEVRPVALRSLVDAAVEACRPGLEEKQQSLTIDWPAEDLLVNVDPVRITQAMSNLLSNAAKYTPAGGRIGLRVRAGEDVQISVQDNGIGIAPASLERVFELFAQVGAGAHAHGLGIGLFLVRSVVEMHGGSVTAASAGEGQGSCFTLTLPPSAVVERRAPPPAEREAAPAPARAAAGKRFLVVDDNTDAAATLAMLLEMLGHTVGVAHGGDQALAMVGAFDPDIVVLDIGMPGMDGYEVARRLKQRTDLRRQPLLVAATGWGTEADRARAMAAGFDRHLTKPIEVEALEAIARTGR